MTNQVRGAWVIALASCVIAVVTVVVGFKVSAHRDVGGTDTAISGPSASAPAMPSGFAADVQNERSNPILPQSRWPPSSVVLLFVVGAGLWLGCMMRVLTKADDYRNATQLIWVLVLLLAGPVGAVLFLLLGAGSQDADKPLRHRADVSGSAVT